MEVCRKVWQGTPCGEQLTIACFQWRETGVVFHTGVEEV